MRLKPVISIGALAAMAVALSACNAPLNRAYKRAVIDRALSSAPYAAQPSQVVARELEFARAAREDGQWTAFRAFAADDALLHGRNGPVPAKQVLATLDDPEKAVEWSPRTVAMSCDGTMAVSRGRFLDPEGYVGTYVTVWEREDYDDDYEWSYDVGGRDDPQPVREEPEDGAILVTAYDDIQGVVADCPKAGETVPRPVFTVRPGSEDLGAEVSADGTLAWGWVHLPGGKKFVYARHWKDGEWTDVFRETLASPPEE